MLDREKDRLCELICAKVRAEIEDPDYASCAIADLALVTTERGLRAWREEYRPLLTGRATGSEGTA